MKVTGTSSVSAQGGARGAAAAAPGFALPDLGVRAAGAPPPAVAASALANVGSLLALQGVEDPAERRRRATRRADDLLDALDGLRVATLGGGVSREQVARLAAALRERRDEVDDPALDSILDEVELRAEVELAKWQRAP